MTKRTFEIEWPVDHGPLWMNRDNLLICLTHACRNTEFTVRDVTGDDACDPKPATAGPVPAAGSAEIACLNETVREAVDTLAGYEREVRDQDAEIARLRAEVARLREVLDEARTTCRRAAAQFVEVYGEDRSANERWCRATMEKITAATADTADKESTSVRAVCDVDDAVLALVRAAIHRADGWEPSAEQAGPD